MVVDLDRFAMDQTASFDDETMINANDNQLNDWMMPLVGAFESTFEICSIYATTIVLGEILSGTFLTNTGCPQ
jgi:hypothetical protein